MATFKEIIERKKTIEEKRSSHKKNLEYFIRARRGTVHDANKAYEAADMARYNELKKSINLLDDYIEKDYEELEKLNGTDPECEVVEDAWNIHVEDYNNRFSAAYSDYLSNQKALAEQFIELIEMQNSILKDREDIISFYPNFSSKYLAVPKMIDSPIDPITYRGFNTNPEIAFFAFYGEIPKNKIYKTSNILIGRIADGKGIFDIVDPYPKQTAG